MMTLPLSAPNSEVRFTSAVSEWDRDDLKPGPEGDCSRLRAV